MAAETQTMPPELQEAYDSVTEYFPVETDDPIEVDDFGKYYPYTINAAGERFILHIGDIDNDAPESEQPAFRMVLSRAGMSEKDSRFWRVMVDLDGNALVQKKNSMFKDSTILELAADVLEHGDVID